MQAVHLVILRYPTPATGSCVDITVRTCIAIHYLLQVCTVHLDSSGDAGSIIVADAMGTTIADVQR